MHYNVVIDVLLIDILAIMSPGPDFFIVLKSSLTNSIKAGIYAALGITLGSTLIFSVGIFGVGMVIAHSKLLFNMLKFAGSGYLTYLALNSILSKPQIQEPQLLYVGSKLNVAFNQYFKRGLICNLSNPKAFMFIVSLSTYVVEHGDALKDGLLVIIGSALATFVWFSSVARVFGTIAVRKIFYKQQRLINIIFGVVLLYIAFKIIQL